MFLRHSARCFLPGLAGVTLFAIQPHRCDSQAPDGTSLVLPTTFPISTLEESVTSCFTLLVFTPPHARTRGLAPGRESQGYAFELGSKEASVRDPSVTYWRHMNATVPRALLVMHSRGGLELPGGGRSKGESLPAAAERELREETGVRLREPLTHQDAALTLVKGGVPKWQLFLRRVDSGEDFSMTPLPPPTNGGGGGDWGYATPWGGSAFSNIGEVWGLAGVPLSVEIPGGSSSNSSKGGGGVGGKGTTAKAVGLPRALAFMEEWQGDFILPLLLVKGVLTVDEARTVARCTDAYLAVRGWGEGGEGDGEGKKNKGGPRRSKPLGLALEEALVTLGMAGGGDGGSGVQQGVGQRENTNSA